jgi:hypothetical protein
MRSNQARWGILCTYFGAWGSMLTARAICYRTIKILLLAQNLKVEDFGQYDTCSGQTSLHSDAIECVGGLGLLTLMLGAPD